MAHGKQVKNPQTGIMIELPGKEVAQLTVVSSVGTGINEISLCEVSSGSLKDLALTTLYVQEKNTQ